MNLASSSDCGARAGHAENARLAAPSIHATSNHLENRVESVISNEVKSAINHSATPQLKNTPLMLRRRRLTIAWATTASKAASRIGYAVQIVRVSTG